MKDTKKIISSETLIRNYDNTDRLIILLEREKIK